MSKWIVRCYEPGLYYDLTSEPVDKETAENIYGEHTFYDRIHNGRQETWEKRDNLLIRLKEVFQE